MGERKDSGLAVIARLRPQLAKVVGLQVFLSPVQDVRSGGRSSNSTYQYTLKSDSQADLRTWATKLADELKQTPALTDVDTDQQENGIQTMVQVNYEEARRLGLTASSIDNAMYNAFGQRQVATIYTELNQYHVVMEWAQPYTAHARIRALQRRLRAFHPADRDRRPTAPSTEAGPAATSSTASASTPPCQRQPGPARVRVDRQ